MSRRRSNADGDVIGCLAYVLLIIFLMPIVGLVLVCGKNPDRKPLGWVLLVVGTILWIWLAVASA